MNKDQENGRVEETKAKVKELARNLLGNDQMQQEGNLEKTFAKSKTGIGDLKNDIKNASKHFF